MGAGALWPWLTYAGLGAYHGINPAMGWLFAVALGLQEKRRGAVLQALLPIALGHAASVAIVVSLVVLTQMVLPHVMLRGVCAAALLSFGLLRLLRARHPRWVGMRVGARDLAVWSFIMSSVHGAGLMLVPVLLRCSLATSHPAAPLQRFAAAPFVAQLAHRGDLGLLLTATGMHTLGLLVVAGGTAVIVYEKVGLSLLRRAWVNLDLVWSIALLATGVLIPLV